MKLYINANTLTDKNIGSIGRMIINVVKELEKFSEVNIYLISDIKINKKIFDLLNNKNIKENIYLGKKVKNIQDFFIYYLPWVYKLLDNKNLDFFWEPQNYLLKKFNHFKTVVTIHDVFPLEPIANRNFFKRKLFYFFIKKTLSNATYIQTPSNFTASRINYFFSKANKIYTIYHGVETNVFTNRENNEKDINYEYALFLGRISYWKGVDFLLNVAEEFYKKTLCKIILAGAIIDNALKIKIEELEKKSVIRYLGFISDEYKNYLIKNTRLFLYPSRYDGFGQPPLEAIKKNKNILMSNISVLREITNDLGYYFELDDKNDFLINSMRSIKDADNKKLNLFNYVNKLSWRNYVLNFYNYFLKD